MWPGIRGRLKGRDGLVRVEGGWVGRRGEHDRKGREDPLPNSLS